MKKFVLPLAVVISLGAITYGVTRTYENPDPNHTHADFAVWVPVTAQEMQPVDFSDQRYMSEAYDPESGQQLRVDPLRKFLHLHDGNGHVMHRHKPGLTLGEFFESIGARMIKTYVAYEDAVINDCFEWKDTQDEHHIFCSGEFGREMRMYVNGVRVDYDPGYVFDDNDQILIIHALNEQEVATALQQLSDDACLYSQTCPLRGKPPVENCIADPEVPCVEPE